MKKEVGQLLRKFEGMRVSEGPEPEQGYSEDGVQGAEVGRRV